ncbi:hypothetical protein GCM10009838_72660 [Catenulispora subtropica]|uniref:Uncharacterized protein n=1 Tax=Catenulispora subtropica TaxID=450798 RepID=A0ABP5EIK0_9ACTN
MDGGRGRDWTERVRGGCPPDRYRRVTSVIPILHLETAGGNRQSRIRAVQGAEKGAETPNRPARGLMTGDGRLG